MERRLFYGRFGGSRVNLMALLDIPADSAPKARSSEKGSWGVHGMAVDSAGNVYTAAVDSGGAQKFTPRAGANPAFLLGAQVTPGWAD